MYFFHCFPVMTMRPLLLWTWLMLQCVYCTGSSCGKEFITVFLQNLGKKQLGPPKFELRLTGYHPTTSITVTVNKSSFRKTVSLNEQETISVVVPVSVEMVGSSIFDKSVLIQADKDISLLSFSCKAHSIGTTIVHPVQQLGRLYYVVTPSTDSPDTYKEFAVVAHQFPARVKIHLKAAVIFNGHVYPAGSILVSYLRSFQAIQLQSSDDLSGTKVESNELVAVLSGHSCASRHSRCDHVIEQLLPIPSWGASFIVPPLSLQTHFDIVHVTASQDTPLRYQYGPIQGFYNVVAGKALQFKIRPPWPLYLSANAGIQVLYFFTGAKKGSNEVGPFLINVPAFTSYCTSYHIQGVKKFHNFAIIVTKASESRGFVLQNMPSGKIQWKPVPSTEYLFGQLSLGEKNILTVAHPHSPFWIFSFGSSSHGGYGSASPCSCSKPMPSCDSIQCSKKKKKCEIQDGHPVCIAESESTCWTQGDLHYHTFDGANFDFMGTCTYIMARTCRQNTSLPSFSVKTKNDNWGNTRASYLASVSIVVYHVTITVARNEIGFIRVNNQRFQLPISLNEGKLLLYQSGNSAVIETDFLLTVSYDWKNYLVVKIRSNFMEKVCGLCGNFNEDSTDDFTTPEGTLIPNPVTFAKSWKVDDDDRFCWDGCNKKCKSCSPLLTSRYKTNRFSCGLISKGGDGPFASCHSVIDPVIYLENCVHDLCTKDGLKDVLCQVLKSYADSCQQAGVRVSDWRTLTDCPASCPKNSHYESCADPCPATCNNEARPSDCSSHCVEACECDKGYVLDGGQCIPKAACGCIFEGKPFSPGQQFWGDRTCTKLCTCKPQAKQVTCQATKCKTGEECRVENGIRGCYPTRYTTCSASGDSHYITYDGKHFDFQGTCVYQFSGLCEKRKDLVDFLVLVQSDHRGSQSAAFTRVVEIKIYKTSILVSKENPGKVLVNGLLTNLPFSVKGKINVYRRGQAAVIQTDFLLTVTFDWESLVTVTVPSTYAGALCGLCGNYNANKHDELTMRKGGVTSDPLLFGQSWKWREVPGCSEVGKAECSGLSAIGRQQRKLGKECGVLLAKSGPFRGCHSKIDPERYFRDCISDFCVFKGQQAVICPLIASYVAACQATGATLYPWRSDTFCKLSCAPNSHYELCAKGCDQTCDNIDAPAPCQAKCQEGCVCDDGFLLSGDRYVSRSQCGCHHEGRYYLAGEIFYPACQTRCVCRAGGYVNCAPFSCGPGQECRLAGGIWKCNPLGNATCSAGNPHYHSFDGLSYDFHGICTYTLAKVDTNNQHLTSFTVNIENEVQGSGKPSVTKMVSVTVYGITLTLLQKKLGQVEVNGLAQMLPVTFPDGNLQAYQHGTKVLIQTDFGLIVSYDLVCHVSVMVPSTYKGQMRGLCGNYNGRTDDEFLLPGGQTTSDVAVFGGAWKVSESESSCSDGCSGGKCPVCDEKKKDVFKQRNYCGIIIASDGPFSACHRKVDSRVYFKNCIYDLCLGNGDSQVLCRSIQSYMAACQEAGESVKPWRSPSFCPLNCPANSHYKVCTTLCTTSCTKITDPKPCPETCAEGCQCDDGFFFDGLGCVSAERCGCFENGRYYKPNEKVLLNMCQTSCRCVSGQRVICEAHSCTDDQHCKIQDGIMDCFDKGCLHFLKCEQEDGRLKEVELCCDPCKTLKCKEKEICRTENGQAQCIPDFRGICWCYGDQHCHTFDKLSFSLQGTCSYTIAKYCGNDSMLAPFLINGKNDNSGIQVSTFVHPLNIYVYGYKISIYKQETGRIRLNDTICNLPLSLKSAKVKVYQSGHSVVLKTDFGLQVVYDWNKHFMVILPSSYYEATCGLCGNFNQSPADDMTFPNGTKASSMVSWVSSWKDEDQDPFCRDECLGNCLTCEGRKRESYETHEFCGMINKTWGGPFRECHAKVDPGDFFDGCLYDGCVNGHAKNILCHALEAYAETCRKSGAKIYDWRTSSGCVLQCPENSHYEFCGNSCPASCADRTSSSTCKEPCVETCQCNDGYVLSVNKCVPIGGCGCTYNGFYFKPGEEFWADEECGSHCTCDPKLGIVVCKEASCKPFERCVVIKGIRGCHSGRRSTCVASGDPHYTTFDGRRYDFMGTCIYQLVGLCSKDPTLQSFTIKVENNNRGNKRVSFTKVVSLEAYNITIKLSQEHPRKIQVDDVFVNLPYYFGDKIKVYISGREGFIKAEFGLIVTFDWNSYVRVIVPTIYTNAVCGLCGNNNQNPKDDLIMMDGKLSNSISQFAESWKTAEVPGCSKGCTDDCPVCADEQKKIYRGDQYCGILIQRSGPFRQCFDAVDPAPYFSDCVFDTCQHHGHHDTLCNALSIYVAACQDLGVQIEQWRSDFFCSLTCPLNSHYELCGNSCPATCHSLSAPDGCDTFCKEGCYCNAGFVLSGDQCAAVSDCGCLHQGKYYKKGEEFFPGPTCQQKCRCLENGATACQPFSCGPHEKCKVEKGNRGCHPAGYGKCSVFVGSHYLTFDGRTFNFQGTCMYALAAHSGSGSHLVNFSVWVKNEKTLIKKVVVSLHGYIAIFETSWPRKIKVDGEQYTLPMGTRDGKVWANQEGNNIIIQSTSGIKVIYDSTSCVLVFVPSTYQGHVHGLCGNFNNDKSDDFTLPSGNQTQSVDVFGASWNVLTKNDSCSHGCDNNCPICDATKTSPYRPESSCGMILSKSGSFKDCHSLVDPTDYFKHCLYEMCAFKGARDAHCRSIQAYVVACQAAGGTIRPWRTKDFCPFSCSSRSHYEICTRSCDSACTSLFTPGRCTQKCFEGCQCDNGFLFDGDTCVAMENCGCMYEGCYIKAGNSILLEGCLKNCTCYPSSKLVCAKSHCQEREKCTLHNGIRVCMGQRGKCVLSSRTQLTSFDGASGQILNKGVYEVASLCHRNESFWFRILAVVQNSEEGDFLAVSTMHVFFQSIFMTIKKSKEAWINGHLVELPSKPSEDVSVSASPNGVIIDLASEVKVFFRSSGEVMVEVSQSLEGKLCAFCGNFNGNMTDDLRLPNGKMAGSITELMDAWKAVDFSIQDT